MDGSNENEELLHHELHLPVGCVTSGRCRTRAHPPEQAERGRGRVALTGERSSTSPQPTAEETGSAEMKHSPALAVD
ncbi:hypothetical protein AOLI_G00020640 [Acnodon oligacanthus]